MLLLLLLLQLSQLVLVSVLVVVVVLLVLLLLSWPVKWRVVQGEVSWCRSRLCLQPGPVCPRVVS